MQFVEALLLVCLFALYEIKSSCLFFTLCVSYQDQAGEQAEDHETEEQLQARILNAALDFVPEHGWTVEAIAAGAEVKQQRLDDRVM